MDKPKRIHQKSMSLVLAFVLTLICVLTQNPVVFAADTGNEWVYDESNVISKDTEDYIKNLNENIFSVYKNKPQLAKRFCIVLRTKELFLKGKVCDNNENIVLYK